MQSKESSTPWHNVKSLPLSIILIGRAGNVPYLMPVTVNDARIGVLAMLVR